MNQRAGRSSSELDGGPQCSEKPGSEDGMPSPPASLTRTSVYRRIPTLLRSELDQALLLRPKGYATLNAVADKFQLVSKFGITPRALRTYARKLEELLRPLFAGQLLASLMGCLPEAYRRQVNDGGDVLLISRIVQALTETETRLAVPELARAACVFGSNTGSKNVSHSPKESYGETSSREPVQIEGSSAMKDSNRLVHVTRMVYGLDWSVGLRAKPNTEPPNMQPLAKQVMKTDDTI